MRVMPVADARGFGLLTVLLWLSLLATTALCGATSVFQRLWADLGAIAPRLALASAGIAGPGGPLSTSEGWSIPADRPRVALASLVVAARRRDARLFVDQMERAPALVAADGCGIDALGPMLWRLLHVVAQLDTHVLVGGRPVRPIAYLLVMFPGYFPPRCPCRANYVGRLPKIRRFLRAHPDLAPDLALRLTVDLHAAVNRSLGRAPFAHHGSAENAMFFWRGQCAVSS